MEDSREVPQYAGTSNGLAALRRGAAVVDRSDRTILRLTGKDPVGMLNATLTNEVPKEAVHGVYAMLLNPKGRVQTDLRVVKSGEDVLIDTEPEGALAAREILGRYAPFSRVKLEDLSGSWSVLGLYGPNAGGLLGGPEPAEHASVRVEIGGRTLLAVGVACPFHGYDLIGPADDIEAAREALSERGAISADRLTYETARIEAGVPRFGADITPDNFPGETAALSRAVSFQKGCYPGQETVARMHYRGHPNKTLHRLAIQGARVQAGESITQNGKAVGLVTSVAPLPVGGRILALGYLSRGADTEGSLLSGNAGIRVLGTTS
ncbi:MAG: YgfZ/GcvT domain-containing protein [Rubrobacter sp.]